MALSNLNLLSASSYFALVYDMIKKAENPFLYAGTGFQRIHDGGGDGNPTFGYGFNLAAFSASVVEQVILHAYGGSVTSQQRAGLDIVLDWKTGAPLVVNGVGVTLTNADIINMADVTLDGAPGAFGSAAQRDAVQSLFLNDAQATRMLDVMIKGDLGLVHIEGPAGSFGYEAGLDYRLTEEGVPAYSTERAALLSAYYNAPTLIGPGVQNAILNDDRPQLWYEIRYNHNHYDLRGLQNRRAGESDLLGLVSQAAKDDPQNHLQEFADAASTLFNDGDRLGRRIYTQINARDIYDPFPASIAPELATLDLYLGRGALGDPLAPAIDWVQFDDAGASSAIDAADEASAGVVGGKDLTNTVNLILGEAGDDLIRGYGATDYLYGGLDRDTIYGGDGDDYIHGGADDDWLVGEAGDDFIRGASGADTIDSGAGDDTLKGDEGDDRIFAGFGDDRADAGAGNDLVRSGPGNDTLFGGDGNDTLGASNRSDYLRGDAGDDLLLGSNGNDRLFGGDGADTLLGGNGSDRLAGEGGADRLRGEAGNDIFVFAPGCGADLVVDFEAGAGPGDVISLVGFGASLDSFAEAIAAATQVGANVVIDLGGGETITLQGVSVASLAADDFAFS